MPNNLKIGWGIFIAFLFIGQWLLWYSQEQTAKDSLVWIKSELLKLKSDQTRIQKNVDTFTVKVDALAVKIETLQNQTVLRLTDFKKEEDVQQQDTKQWIKASVLTLASFEHDLHAMNKSVEDIIYLRLPILEKALNQKYYEKFKFPVYDVY